MEILEHILRIDALISIGDVTTRQVNYDFPTFNAPYGTGMSSFNGSLAPFLAIQVDRVFHSTMTAFLKSGEIAVDITSPDLKAMSCAQGPTLGRTPTCQRTVFMPGTVPGEFMLQNELPDADISMAYGLQGYVLDFGKGDENKTWQFEERECEVIGLAFGAVSLCIHNTDSNENEIQARMCRFFTIFQTVVWLLVADVAAGMVKCPSRMAVASECLSNTSWHTNFTSMVTTSLNATFNWADVAYHRPNGSIAWYSLKDKQGKAAIPARELLDAYKSFALGATSFQNMISQWAQDHPELLSSVDSVDEDEAAGISELLDIVESLSGSPAPKKRQLNTDNILSSFSSLLGGTGGSGLPTNVFEMGTNPLFPIAPYMMLETVAVAAAENPAMSIVATDFLQNFLAIPLFWCQNLMTVRGTVQGIGGIDIESILGASEGEANELVQAIESLMGVDEQTLQRLRSQTEPSKLAFSRLGYEVQMGKLSLVAYIVLTALLLAGCFAALTVGSIERWAGGIPPTGPFGLCDNMTHLVVRVDGRILEENDWSMACSTTGTSELLGEMRLARVSLKRSVDGPQRPWLET